MTGFIEPTRALILGEQPGTPHTDAEGIYMPNFPFAGGCARTLLKAFDTAKYGAPKTHADVGYPGRPVWRRYYWPLLEEFELENVFQDSDQGKYTYEWVKAIKALEEKHPSLVVIVCGRAIMRAMASDAAFRARMPPPFFKWFTWRSWDCVNIPHPSGSNRAWNDPAAYENAGRVMVEAQQRAAGSDLTGVDIVKRRGCLTGEVKRLMESDTLYIRYDVPLEIRDE